MKRRPEQTKEQRKTELRFIRKGTPRLRKHKKLINGNMTKEDLVNLLAALWKNLEKITVNIPKLNRFGYYELDKDNGVIYKEKRKYKNIPAFNHFNKYSRKILVGMYGSTLQIARKEGLFN